MDFKSYLKELAHFSEEEIVYILSQFQEEKISKNQIILREGKTCKKLYFLQKGLGRSFYINEQGKEITQWFFGDGKFMTSFESLIQEKPSFYFIEVLEDSIVYSISKQKIDLLFEKYHKMERLGRMATTEMLSKVVTKLNAIQFQKAKDRYKYMLAEYPNIANRVPLGHIASYLGMTQETLSRIRKQK